MSRGWWIYAGVLSVLTILAIGSAGNGIDILVGVVANLVFLVLLPFLVVRGVQRARQKKEA